MIISSHTHSLKFYMHNFFVLLLGFLLISAPATSFSFDLGAAASGYQIANSNGRSDKQTQEKAAEALARKIDNEGEFFVTDGTRKERIVKRFEQALIDSALTPSERSSFTKPIRIAPEAIYELWKSVIFTDKQGAKHITADRYFVYCEKGLIAEPSVILYDLSEDVRTVSRVYLTASVFEISKTGLFREAHDLACSSDNKDKVVESPASK